MRIVCTRINRVLTSFNEAILCKQLSSGVAARPRQGNRRSKRSTAVGPNSTAAITLNDAIQTGNYTVLRDRGAPGFREVNSAARLSQSFSDIASKNIDLSAVTVMAPQLTEPPGLGQQKGMLHLKGYFPSKPVQVNFEVLYQSVAGRWQLFGLSVQPSAPTSAPQTASDPASNPAKNTLSSAVKKK